MTLVEARASHPAATASHPAAEISNTGDSDSDDSDDSDTGDWPDETPPGFLDPDQIADEELDRVLVLLPQGRGLLRRRGPAIARVGVSRIIRKVIRRRRLTRQELTFRNEAIMREEIRRLLAAVGRDHLAIAASGGGVSLDSKGLLSLS